MNAFEDRARTKSIILKNNKTKDKVTWMDDNGVPWPKKYNHHLVSPTWGTLKKKREYKLVDHTLPLQILSPSVKF